MIRLALVGFGGYGGGLIEVIQRVADRAGCRLVAAADARLSALPEEAKKLAEAGVELFDDALRMFDALRGRCEAVYVATSIGTHAPLTIAAAQAGYHVHCEKPPAATVQEIDAMLAALRAAGRFCLVGFQALHAADIRLVKDRVVSGRLGRVRSLACRAAWPRNRSYYTRNDWAGKLRSGEVWVLDGPATNALAHQITNMLFLASPTPNRLATPTSVRAELYAAGPVESHDTAAIEIRTAEGPAAYFLASHCSDATFGPIIEIDAELGQAVWQMGQGATITYADATQESAREGNDRERDAMVANFIEAVRANDPSGLRCELSATRPFVLALDGAHESSGRIHRIPASSSHRVDEGTDKARTIIEGIDDLLTRAARERKLFSDLAEAPSWTVETRGFGLQAYERFPVSFAV